MLDQMLLIAKSDFLHTFFVLLKMFELFNSWFRLIRKLEKNLLLHPSIHFSCNTSYTQQNTQLSPLVTKKKDQISTYIADKFKSMSLKKDLSILNIDFWKKNINGFLIIHCLNEMHFWYTAKCFRYIAFKIPIIESLNPGTNPDRNFHTKYRTSVFHCLMCCTISLMLITFNIFVECFYRNVLKDKWNNE